jgi:hypothetical protein
LTAVNKPELASKWDTSVPRHRSTVEHDPPRRIDGVDLEHVLGDIEPDGGDSRQIGG